MKTLLEKISSAAEVGVDWVQIREKDLAAAALSELVREAIRCVPATCKILVNDRLDVACALGAAGVHLGERSIPVSEARRFVRERGMSKQFLIGASVHSLETAIAAEKDGADYLIFGPVFATPSKAAFGDPQGLERLKEVCNTLAIPVLAIGGITLKNAGECYLSGASGVAAIRLFQKVPELAEAVTQLRACGVREPNSRF
jgi:thiamine-phosphate pyrophosphorylase